MSEIQLDKPSPDWKWALKVSGLSHWFGDKKVLYNINLRVKAGQIVALVGPSGCGKSTLLRAILGTHPPKEGTVLASNKPVVRPTRDVGVVYQHYSLYDFLTARENVAFGLHRAFSSIPQRIFRPFQWRSIRKQHFAEADLMLNKVGLKDCGDLYPNELSGGMRQRVAVAQCLIMKPSITLLDEPFGALDEANREALQLMLLNLYQENIQAKRENRRPPNTILIVTHELNEALYVSDRLIGLSQYHADGKNGATIVYDQPSPVFRPNDTKDFSRFSQQKEDVRNVVFSPDSKRQTEQWVAAWNEADLPGISGNGNGNCDLSPERI